MLVELVRIFHSKNKRNINQIKIRMIMISLNNFNRKKILNKLIFLINNKRILVMMKEINKIYFYKIYIKKNKVKNSLIKINN